MSKKKIDRVFLFIVIALISIGALIFSSASLGILAKSEVKFYNIIASQFLLGLSGGLLLMALFSKIPIRIWKKYAFPIFILSLGITSLVFLPGIGIEHAGAKRWIDLGVLSFQPSEFLKFGLIVFLAMWFSKTNERTGTFRYGLLPFLLITGLAGALLLNQPDTGTFIALLSGALAIYVVAGASWKHLGTLIIIGIIGASLLALFRPYVKDRLMTFIDPSRDPRGSAYQIQQSLIAIGSGEVFGRGLGQSVQKFNYLPEPVGDSIFAVIGEETGFIGGSAVVILFLLFGLRGLKIAGNSSEQFGKLLAVGFTSIIVAQSFLNIASLIGIFPLTGVPLIFMSHGGSALLFALMEVGVILSVSRR